MYSNEMARNKMLVQKLENGEVAIVPTDTLFAMTCDAYNDKAVAQVFALKNRSVDKTVPIFVDSIEMVEKIAVINDTARSLIQKYWPGALTLVLLLKDDVNLPSMISKDNTIAVRMPNNQELLNSVSQLGNPIIGTSANLSGESNVLTVLEAKSKFPSLYVVEQELQSRENSASTIVSCINKKAIVLRQGVLKLDI